MDDLRDTTWSDIAGWYDELLVGGSGPHELATATTLSLMPPLSGLDVLDVACGQGMATRALAAAGAASVVGTDLCEEQIDRARAHGSDDLGIEYRVDDAHTLASVGDASVDVANCQLALMDIPDLDATLAAVRRVVRPGGTFVFVIGHPCFLAPDAQTIEGHDGRLGRFVGDYFDERFWRSTNPNGVRRVGNHHRTLSTYLNALMASGLVLEHVVEPAATGLLADQQPEYRNVPIFLGARARPI